VTIADDLRVEARQLRLLWRDSVRRLLNNVAASRDADASAFVLWAGTLALTLPLLFSMRRVMMYQFVSRLPAAEIDAMLRRDHLFFIVYSMLAAALLAVIVWDAMFPDRTDQEIIGVLPVRPRTSALARLAGAVTVCLVSAAAIAIPPAVLYSLAMTTFTGLLGFPRLFAGQVVATMGVAAFVFFVLMTARGLIALVAGQRGADRLALLLQVVTIVSIVEGLVFLPGMLARAQGADGDTLRALLPPLWFSATYGWIAGTGAVPWREALFGPAMTAGVFLVLSAISVVPADWMGRRALLATGRARASRLTAVMTAVSLVVARSGPARAMFRFAIRSIVTSRRHLLLLSTRFGMATALSLLGLMMIKTSEGLAFDRPRGYWLAPPLILIYFTLIGLRSCLAIPSDIEANWVFRLIEPSVGAVRRASRLVLLVAGVVPVVLVFATISLSAWPAISALRTIALVAVSGIAIAELVLWGWTHVPFATAHPPNPNTIKSGWPRHVAAMIAVGLLLPALFVALSRSTRGTLIYTAVAALVTLAVRFHNERELRLSRASFEAGEQEVLTLQLSEAAH
jgi:hypothetical protein